MLNSSRLDQHGAIHHHELSAFKKMVEKNLKGISRSEFMRRAVLHGLFLESDVPQHNIFVRRDDWKQCGKPYSDKMSKIEFIQRISGFILE